MTAVMDQLQKTVPNLACHTELSCRCSIYALVSPVISSLSK